MSALRFGAEYVPSGPADLTSAVAETSTSTMTASAGLIGARSVAETSTSVMASAETRIAATSVAESSTSAMALASIVQAFRTATLGASLSSASAAGRLLGSRAISETSLSDALAVPIGPNSTTVISLSSVSARGSLTGAPVTVVEVSISDIDSIPPFGAQDAWASETSTSTLAVSSNTMGVRSSLETSLSDLGVTVSGRKSAFIIETSISRDDIAFHRFLGANANETSTSTFSAVARAKATGFQVRIREKAPLRLSVGVSSPAGGKARWAIDDPNPKNVPGGLAFSTTMPGGFEQMSCVLSRDPKLSYPDLTELSTLTAYGAGKLIAHQSRLESLPDQSGDQISVSPGAVGWQAHLDDDNSAREIFVDQDIATWIGPSVQRQIQWLQQQFPVMANGPSVAPDVTTNFPSLLTELSGAWTENQIVEAWYDAHGIPIGSLFAAWKVGPTFSLVGGNDFGAAMFLASEDTAVNYDRYPSGSSSSLPSNGQATMQATNSRPFAVLQFWNDTVPGGKDGTNFDVFWTALGVYGRHGLPLYAPPGGGTQGVRASDAVAYAINKWCPKLKYSVGATGTIQDSLFVIPHLVFLDPTKVSDMIKEATKYELLDWAVWEGPTGDPTFYMNQRGARGRKWLARSGPAKLQQAGPQISRMWNGVIVQWTDVTGVTRTVGPTGSGANNIDPTLVDNDPLNPINQAGMKKYALVTMGLSTLAGATQVGRLFLQEQKLLSIAGQASLTGYVRDDKGILWPAWMVRAGDQIAFTDSSDTSYRRIVHTQYDDASKTNAIQLDQPPDSLQAILERLSVVLTPYGMS